jgi:hypothetical protein
VADQLYEIAPSPSWSAPLFLWRLWWVRGSLRNGCHLMMLRCNSWKMRWRLALRWPR